VEQQVTFSVESVLFWVFSAVMLLSATLAITRKDTVNAAMMLIQTFLCIGGIFLLLNAFYLAVIQVLVYAGAVVVLFLFVIMLLNPLEAGLRAGPLQLFGVGLTFTALLGVFAMALAGNASSGGALADKPAQGLPEIMHMLFSRYLLPFELVALILLVAMVGVVVLARKGEDT
jgi:NADH-quinone oxidoreductase subunit J